jgi:hypothetical protein
MVVSCVLLAVLCSAVVAHGAEIIDVAWTGVAWMALYDDGTLKGDWAPNIIICDAMMGSYPSYPGACALDGVDGASVEGAVLAFPNGDLQRLTFNAQPDGALIPGPPGASGIEEVKIGGNCDTYTIRSGCVFWAWRAGTWYGPCEPFGMGASEAPAESWGEIKAEFKD